MHFTLPLRLALLLALLLFGSSGLACVAAAPADQFFHGHLTLPSPDEGVSQLIADDLLGEAEEKMPSTPNVFVSPDHLRTYLSKLNAYYAIAGRPRFGKRTQSWPSTRSHKLRVRGNRKAMDEAAAQDYFSDY